MPDRVEQRSVILKFPKSRPGLDAMLRTALLRETWIASHIRSPFVTEAIEPPAERRSCIYGVLPDYAGETLIFHAGAVQGYRAMIAFLPGHRFGVVMLWNSESAAPSGLMPMLIDRYLGLPEVNWAGIDKSDTEDLAGGGAN